MTLRIAALVKQIPAFESMTLGADGRLVRAGLELEMSAYCRRAVAQAVALVMDQGGSVTVITLGPPSAEDCLREAIAWGLDRDVEISGVHITDAVFAGSDTLATAQALAATINHSGPFELILAGRNSVDADTGQVGPELAQLLDLPFVTTARHLALTNGTLDIRSEHDDGWAQVRVGLPAVVSTAERLIEPCKVEPSGRAAVDAERIRRVTAADLGTGPWGAGASPTVVGATRLVESSRLRRRAPALALAEQVRIAVEVLTDRGALDRGPDEGGPDEGGPGERGADEHGDAPAVPEIGPIDAPIIGVIVEPDRARLTQELLGAAAALGGSGVALTNEPGDATELGSWGADTIVELEGITLANEQDTAAAVALWAHVFEPWAILAPSTAWGREVAARIAADLRTGLTGDAVALDRDGDALVACKPAFGGQIVAEIRCRTLPQMATVRAGVLARRKPRVHTAPVTVMPATALSRVEILVRTRDDDLNRLADAHAVVAVGQAVDPSDYPNLDPLLEVLGAQLAATRKVTDLGWLPRARQIGITGRTIAPRVAVSIGAGGKFNHMVGMRTAGTILAINQDPNAMIFDAADVGIVGDYREVVPMLVAALRAASGGGLK